MIGTTPATPPEAKYALAQAAPQVRHGWWWKSLLVGLVLWMLTAVVTAVTRNANLVPALILLGSFLVPFTVVMFAAERVEALQSTSLIGIFFVAGVCGILGAALLESVLTQSPILFLFVGLIEEFVKGAIVVIVAWRMSFRSWHQGALIGATVGAGFAAFESAGYALISSLSSQGISLIQLLQTEALRALLTPVAHVLWTAILGAVIFGSVAKGVTLRSVLAIVGAYAGIAILHGLWDSMSGIATILAGVASGAAFQYSRLGFVGPGTLRIANLLEITFYWAGLALVSAVGVIALALLMRRRQRIAAPAAVAL